MNQRTEQIFNEPCKIGFMQPFPVKGEPLVTKTYNLFCRSIPVEVEVSKVKVTYGKNNEFECTAVVTNRVDISNRLSLGGHGSYCHLSEADTMKHAAKLFCEEEGIELCQLINNWPSFKAI